MSYSSIRKKKCKCGTKDEPCKLFPTLGYDGYAKAHAPQNIIDSQDKKAKETRKKYNKKLHQKVMALKEDNKEESVQELWFRMAAIELESNPYCMECSEWIGEPFYRSATAHILPKRKVYGFPSIATHPLNKLFLCTINGCHDKTHTWSTFATMKVWPLAVTAFKEMYPFIAENERKNIPEILRQFINEIATH